MNAVVSLRVVDDRGDGLRLIHSVAQELGVTATHAEDDSWELCLRGSYQAAHRSVVDALQRAAFDWRRQVIVEYALAV